jgi:hypothetical protein
MSRKGNCWVNSFKNERCHGLRYAKHADMTAASFEYIEVFYNRKRQHSTLGYRSPKYFAQWTDEQNQEKQAAYNLPDGRRNTERTLQSARCTTCLPPCAAMADWA